MKFWRPESTNLISRSHQRNLSAFINFFYAPEGHIMYLTVVSWFLISFVIGGSDPGRANKFLYAPAPSSPSVWALKPPVWALVHKTTYVPMIFTALCIMFFGHQMALAYRLYDITQGSKSFQFPGPNPLPIALVMDMHASKTLCTWLYKYRWINSLNNKFPSIDAW